MNNTYYYVSVYSINLPFESVSQQQWSQSAVFFFIWSWFPQNMLIYNILLLPPWITLRASYLNGLLYRINIGSYYKANLKRCMCLITAPTQPHSSTNIQRTLKWTHEYCNRYLTQSPVKAICDFIYTVLWFTQYVPPKTIDTIYVYCLCYHYRFNKRYSLFIIYDITKHNYNTLSRDKNETTAMLEGIETHYPLNPLPSYLIYFSSIIKDSDLT